MQLLRVYAVCAQEITIVFGETPWMTGREPAAATHLAMILNNRIVGHRNRGSALRAVEQTSVHTDTREYDCGRQSYTGPSA